MEREQGMSTESHGMKRTNGTSLWVRAKRRGAEVLRTCAGVAAGWRGERRGTFLVLVVGVLALLSVIAIVYSAIGVGDRTRSFAVVKADRVNQVPDEVRDWIAGIIAGDVLDTYYDTKPATGLPRLRREATDYPWTEWNVTSTITGYQANRDMLFTNSGGFDASRPRADWSQQWLPGDPWLASTSPTWIRGGVSPTRNGVLNQGDNLADHERDWLHISNIAPDGRYVNLSNLRDNFEALPGITNGQMSYGLTLLNHNAGSVALAVVNPPSTDFGVAIDATKYDHPAYWSNRQVGLFRPVTSAGNPGSATYFNYQYADADGDGFYDSRWQELVNASDPNNVFSVITKDPKYRWFVAARIVDLSSLVNVNTATDLITPPSAEAPIGTSPAEVDLWRLLTQVDVVDAYGYTLDGTGVPQALAGVRFGYDALPGRTNDRNERAQEAGYYDNYVPAALGVPVGGHAYRSLRVGVASGLVPPLALMNNGNATAIAGQTIAPWGDAGGVNGIYAFDMGLMTPAKLSLWKFDRYVAPAGWRTNDASDGAYARRSYYERRVADLGGAGRNVDNAGTVQNSYSSSLVFGLPDLAELLTRRGINDPEVRSPLEMALAGRTDAPTANPSLLRYSPMRENRPLAFELAWDVDSRGYSNGLIEPLAYRGRAADVRQYLTAISGARPLSSVENVDLTRLDAKELKIDLIKELYTIGTATYTPNLASWQAGDARPENVRLEATRKIFRLYADALLGESARAGAWDVGGAGANLRTLFYGYGGPEKAAYFAAFSAINLQAMALAGSPEASGPYTLIVGEDGRGTLQNGGPGVFPEAYGYNPQTGQVYLNASTTNTVGAIGGRRLDMNAGNISATTGRTTRDAELGATGTRLAPSGVTTLTPGGVATVYPAEAQPFITGVACYTLYADAPATGRAGPNVGAVSEYRAASGPDPEVRGPMTIRPAVRNDNADFLFRVLAFQIHNPHGVAITLSSPDEVDAVGSAQNPTFNTQYLDIGSSDYPAMDKQRDFHYLRFGNRTFKLVSLSEGSSESGMGNEGRRYFYDGDVQDRRNVGAGVQPRPALPGSSVGSGLSEDDAYRDHAMMELDASGRALSGGIGVNAGRIEIPPGKTVVCYALSQVPQKILKRLLAAENTQTPTQYQMSDLEQRSSKMIREFLKKQVKNADTDVSGVYWIPEMDGYRVTNYATGASVTGSGRPGMWNDEPDGSSGGPNGATGRFEAFGGDTTLPATVPILGGNSFGQLLKPHVTDATTPEANKVVYLYRARRFGAEAIQEDAGSATPLGNRRMWDGQGILVSGLRLYPRNVYENDQLLDRFRLPSDGANIRDLDSRIRLPGSSGRDVTVDISGSQTTRADVGDPVDGDDTGMSVMLWASAQRPTDPNGGATSNVPVGAIAAYCIESKSSVANGWNAYTTWKGANHDFAGNLDRNDWGSMNTESFAFWPKELVRRGGGAYRSAGGTMIITAPPMPRANSRVANQEFAKAPNKRVPLITAPPGLNTVINQKALPSPIGARMSYSKTYPMLSVLKDSVSPIGALDAPANAPAAQVERGRIERNLKKLRVTDALLPLAVGGIHVPNLSGVQDLETDWLTLGEMLALTMGYDNGTGTITGSVEDLFRPEPPDYTLSPTDTPARPLSNGNLVLDAYAPFIMGGSGRPGNPVQFDSTANDRRAGLQIPLALGVLDRISTAGVGSLTEMVPGVVNANTMPQMVARTVPMLAPNVARSRAGETAADAALNGGFKPKGAPSGTDALYWWGQNQAIPQDPAANNNTTDLPAEIDVTAALISTRDKGTAYLGLQRVVQYNGRAPATPMPTSLSVVESPTSSGINGDVNGRDGRFFSTLIDGINEQPGFRSLGEILCSRNRATPGTPNAIFEPSYGMPYNIDYAGYDVITPTARATSANVNNSFVGVDGAMTYAEGEAAPAAISGRAGVRPNGATENVTIPMSATTSNTFNAKPNAIGNEQGEKLMIAAGALGSLSVRSDVYAVWFVLHGYQRTDCEGLGPNDPLTPSIARRFMMVVDRSNVVKKGDTPKVLMFKEVPLN